MNNAATQSPADRWLDLVSRLRICADTQAVDQLILELNQTRGTTVVSFVNAHAANLAWKNARFYEDLRSSDLVLRDGIGMKILVKLLGKEAGENLNGTDLIPKFITSAGHYKTMAIWGTQPEYIEAAIQNFPPNRIQITSKCDGFQDPDHYLKQFLSIRPEIVLLAMGMPKQEHVARLLAGAGTEDNVVIINGGAIIDFMSGRFERAPLIMRRMGLEWFYRLLKEPRRLWKRYVIGNFVFLYRAIGVSIRQRLQ